MRVLHVGKFYPIAGGVEKVMFDLAQGISSKGFRCDVLCVYVGKKYEYSREICLNNKSRVFFEKYLTKLHGATISPQMITHLRRVSRDYEIIHVHHPDPMAALALFFSGYKGKVVLHWHSDILKQKFLLRCYAPLQAWLIHRANLIVGTTPVYVNKSPYLHSVQRKTTFLPIGVDEMTIDYRKVNEIHDQYPGKKIILSIGRLVAYKGFEFLIDAVKFLDDQYVVLIGGGGPLKYNLQSKINSDHLEHRVKLLGFIPDSDKAAYYGACTIFCLSSMMKSEAFAIVQIEAMSCGKPIVATNIEGSGVPWVNRHGYSGLNVIPGDSKAIADAVVEICNGANYLDYCERARKRYLTQFTKSQMVDDCISIYNDLLNDE